MSEVKTVSRVQVEIAQSQIIGARREARDPMRHAGEAIAHREPTLSTVISRYDEIIETVMMMDVRGSFGALKKILSQISNETNSSTVNSDEERENREILEQLNRVYSEEDSLEERNFTEHVLEYYRRKIAEKR